jgi:hypothetical protein
MSVSMARRILSQVAKTANNSNPPGHVAKARPVGTHGAIHPVMERVTGASGMTAII